MQKLEADKARKRKNMIFYLLQNTRNLLHIYMRSPILAVTLRAALENDSTVPAGWYSLSSTKYIPIEICKHLIVLRVRNFSGCKMQFTLHWLQYSTAPNALTLYNKTSQKIKIVF